MLEKIPSVGEVWIFSGTAQCLPAQSCVYIFFINSTWVNYPRMILKYILCCEQSHGKQLWVNNFVQLFIIFLPRVVLLRVATLHNVIVATEYLLGCLECC